jgi:hypothetical protein
VARYGPYGGWRHAAGPPALTDYEVGEVVYDGLGNPVGVLPALIPLIASAIPAVASAAKTVIPAIARAFQRPAPPPPPGPLPPTEPMPIAPPSEPAMPMGPGGPGPVVVAPDGRPLVVVRRRRRRRTLYAR